MSDMEYWSAMRRHVEDGAARYERFRHLPRLIPNCEIWLHARPAVVAEVLHDRIRVARLRQRTCHWTYDKNLHIGLIQAWRAETRAAAELKSAFLRCTGDSESPRVASLSRPEESPGVVPRPPVRGVRAPTLTNSLSDVRDALTLVAIFAIAIGFWVGLPA